MGLRYRKSIKICKGVRVNFSKTGVSYTVGTKGASVNFGRNGVYANTGIPGTGIYARERIDGGSSRTSSFTPAAAEPQTFGIDVVMNDRGEVTLMQNGNVITDETLIRKIKATQSYKDERRRLDSLRRQKINELLAADRKSTDDLLSLYKQAPVAETMAAFREKMDTIEPERYIRNTFQVLPPSAGKIESDLNIEAIKNVNTWAFWKRNKLRQDYVAKRLPGEIAKAQKEWEAKKAAFETQEDETEQQKNKEFLHDWEMTKLGLEKAIEGDPEFLNVLIDSWISDCTFPFDVSIDYSYVPEERKLMLDVDLPEIEDIPNTKMVKLSSGNLSQKKKTQGELKNDYSALVFSLSVFLAANLFGLSPAIESMTMSCFTQRRKSTGDVEDDYILSIRFNREPFEKDGFRKKDPMEFCMGFENRCNMTSTMLFKKIKPFED